jgi:hypothetical protein
VGGRYKKGGRPDIGEKDNFVIDEKDCTPVFAVFAGFVNRYNLLALQFL